MSDAVTILALNSDESGLERFKLNASKAVLCDGSATTQPVSVAGTVGVSGSFFPATQPVSIATNVPVTGTFFQATQPISAASALTVDGSAVTQPVSVAGAVGVTGTFFQATQPVSISGTVATTGGALTVANTSMFSSETIPGSGSAQSSGVDISASLHLIIYGDTNNTSGEIGVEISFDNTNWYDLGANLYPDGATGNFAKEIETSAKYIRLNKSNNTGVTEVITAALMIKS